ncbi:MAG: hypothetical protein K0R41_987 [Geminicoccaceae bacterium]|nr:hypothetical protein [Geminicoccaceae bacterium]
MRPLAIPLLALSLTTGFVRPNLAWSAAETEVDVAVLLAVDVSRSMDYDEQQLQREGYVEAFRSSEVHEAIRKGMLGRVAVVYMEWSGPSDQKVVVPWTVIDGPERALEFSNRLAQVPIGRVLSTSISGTIDHSMKLLSESGVHAARGTIDLSGDGPNNSGRMVTLARDQAVAQRVTINGLPFMLKRWTGWGDIEHLDRYFQDCVIGGPGAFIEKVREAHQFAIAVRRKLVREIVGRTEPESLLRRVKAREPMNCVSAEIQRQSNP